MLRQLVEAAGLQLQTSDEAIVRALDPQVFVATRTTLGGPAPAVTEPAIEASQGRVAESLEWSGAARARLERAARQLDDAFAAL